MELSTEAVAPGVLLRQRNSRLVLETLAGSPRPLRVTEIVSATGLSRPTVEAVAEGLVDQRWLHAADLGRPATGRPAKRYEFNATAGYIAGIDVGAHSVTVVLADLRGATVETIRTPVDPEAVAHERFTVIEQTIRNATSRVGLRVEDPLAWTVGTPGAVSPGEHRVVKSPGVPGWTEFDVAAALATLVRRPVALENDANLAAVGEQASGVARGRADVLFLLLGQRYGAGVIANGSLVRGRHGAAGEVGYVNTAGTRDRSPAYGPLESRVNASGLVADYLRETGAGRVAPSDEEASRPPSSSEILQAAELGKPAAVRVVRRTGRLLADGTAPSVLTLDTDMVVIGGGMSQSSVLKDAFEHRLSQLVLYPPEVRVSTLGNGAVLAGALQLSRMAVETEVLARVTA
ncbi:ROK family transcriptional regulator [Curtobacterium sp. ISL-83]|uniref:ROK family transcriptional regulator n=1 Tax=Curtobacterium sp. ISL-83 TaxID=2819145 RepID=UPI001BE89760|nr:ROK family transcriptional regulator [Curtobacterium sp. ISL-83]MBT2502264.1 ROK family transcriptional regulator [Curtobacterium sp. ISL-83]